MDVTEQHNDRIALEKALAEKQELLAEAAARREQDRIYTRALQDEFAAVQRKGFEQIIGGSPAIQRTLVKVEQATQTDITVLITGETGAGKDRIAQAIHAHSKRAHLPMQVVDCTSLTESLAGTSLFGHEKGAFTGADATRMGSFEVADGSTLFLDEIGELPLELQAKLLRVLDNHVVQRVGGTKPIPVDVRVIAATNRDLEAAVAARTFREDLFFRLNHLRIQVPPLRDRREDIPQLVHHFMKQAAAEYGKQIRSVTPRSMQLLSSYHWPGNVRQLQRMIEVAVMGTQGDTLSIDEQVFVQSSPVPATITNSLSDEVAGFERTIIERTLAETKGKVGGRLGAAVKLNTHPNTLEDRIKALGIDKAKFKEKLVPISSNGNV